MGLRIQNLTTVPKVKAGSEARWFLINGEDKVLGRLASKIALLLRGKNCARFTPHLPGNINVIVTNAKKIWLTGEKVLDKKYYRHTGYPGGLKVRSYKDALESDYEFPLRHAVKGMLPKNRLGRKLILSLKIYAGEEHPHAGQKPTEVKV